MPGGRKRRARERHRYVFVVTYGRSGSTLVQGLLNVLPRTMVRGENGFYLLHLYRALAAVRAFRTRHDKHGGHQPTSAFYGVRRLRYGYFIRAMNGIVRESVLGGTPPDEVDVLGFKEVLWHEIEDDEVVGFFEAMDEAFPGVRYVLNTRAPAEALRSGFWKRADADEARTKIDRVVAVQQHLRETRPERVLDVEYATLTGPDLAARRALLAGLADFVTCRPVEDTVLDRLLETVEQPHGPHSRQRMRDGTAPKE